MQSTVPFCCPFAYAGNYGSCNGNSYTRGLGVFDQNTGNCQPIVNGIRFGMSGWRTVTSQTPQRNGPFTPGRVFWDSGSQKLCVIDAAHECHAK